MKQTRVVVDTSVWIEFFNRPGGTHHRRLSDLLDLDQVAVTGIVAAELLRGCRTATERNDIEAALQGVEHLDIGFRDWLLIGREMFELRREGLTVSLSDAAIAYAARSSGYPLYTLDEDFRAFKGLSRFP